MGPPGGGAGAQAPHGSPSPWAPPAGPTGPLHRLWIFGAWPNDAPRWGSEGAGGRKVAICGSYAGVLGWGRQAVYRVLVSSVEQPSSHVFFVCSRKTQSRGGADPLAPRAVPTGSLRAAWRPHPSTPADCDFSAAGPLAPTEGRRWGGVENPKSGERPRWRKIQNPNSVEPFSMLSLHILPLR